MDINSLNCRLGLDLSEESILPILLHSSYPKQDTLLRKRNKVYESFGRSIVQVAYAIYLYQNNISITPGEISIKINSSYDLIKSKIYENYKLEDFVIKDNPEIGKVHKDIAAKLIVVIYLEKGFLQVYKFLKPFFSVVTSIKNVDYKEAVFHYVQAKKLPFEYKIIDESGPEHDKTFTCQLTIGNKRVVASNTGKKKDAEFAAARKFIKTYNIPVLKGKAKKQTRLSISNNIKISKQRQEQILRVFNLFSINKNYVKIEQMDQVLTHASYVHDHPGQCYKSNETLAVIGAFIVEMFSYEYVLDNYDIEKSEIVKEKGVLIREENIGNTISDQCLLSFLRVMSGDNAKSIIRYKNDIFKSLLAIFLLNYVTDNNSLLFEEGKRFAFEKLKQVEKNKILDYRTFLQEIAHKHRLTLKYSALSYNDRQKLFMSKLDVCNETGVHSISVGSGFTKKEAENKASKEMLLSLFKYLGNDEYSKNAVLNHLDPETRCLMESESKLPKIEPENKFGPVMPIPSKPAALPNMVTEESKIVSFDTPCAVLYICKGTISCKNNNHNITPATGILNNIKGKVVKINVNYCSSCNLYFINYSEYKHYRDLYGVLLGNFLFKNSKGRTIASSYAELEEESLLRICGYTVSQSENLEPFERRLILSNIMDRKLLRKDEILRYLEFFINNSRNRANMRVAVKKWIDDQEWVRNYNIDYQRSFFIGDIKKYQ